MWTSSRRDLERVSLAEGIGVRCAFPWTHASHRGGGSVPSSLIPSTALFFHHVLDSFNMYMRQSLMPKMDCRCNHRRIRRYIVQFRIEKVQFVGECTGENHCVLFSRATTPITKRRHHPVLIHLGNREQRAFESWGREALAAAFASATRL